MSGDTWLAMWMTHGEPCERHMAIHVSQCMAKAHMASHVCDTWHAMCQHAWHTLKVINMGIKFNSKAVQFIEQQASVRGSSKENEEEGKREREERRREMEERKGEREENKRKRKKKREKKRKGREGKERGKGRSVVQ